MTSIGVLDDVDLIVALQHMHLNLRQTEDFEFISSDGKKFTAHSFFLSILSPVLCEKINNDSSFRSLGIDDISVKANHYISNKAIENMIKFIYEFDVNFESISDLIETKILADEFQIYGLIDLCIKSLDDIRVTISNVCSVFITSVEFENESKESDCLTLISINKDDVFTSEPFKTLEFDKVLDIFVKLRDKNSLTESEFLFSGIKWIEAKECTAEENGQMKDELMSKIDVSKMPLDDFLDIIEVYNTFFINVEIGEASHCIRSNRCAKNNLESEKNLRYVNASTNTVEQLFQNAETNTEQTFSDAQTSTEQAFSDAQTSTEQTFCDVQTSTEQTFSDAHTSTEQTFSDAKTNTEEKNDHIEKAQQYRKLKKITVEILTKTDEANALKWSKRVKITAEDGISSRSLQFPMCDELKDGLIGSMKKNKKTFEKEKLDDVTYEGIYYMSRGLHRSTQVLGPLQYFEALKAAKFFRLTELIDKLIINIGSIASHDPAFLDGLNYFKEYFDDKCVDVLKSETMESILHPSFIHCSAELVHLLLGQDPLKITSESQLLFSVIMWLEAGNRCRWHFRSSLLKKIVFGNISVEDFKYALTAYPNFFDEKEKESVLAYKNAKGEENIKMSQENLPEWYNVKKYRTYS